MLPEGGLEAKLELRRARSYIGLGEDAETLARFVVRRPWGDDAAARAEEHFTRVVRRGEAPEDVPEITVARSDSTRLPAVVVDHLGLPSTSEARRLIAQGGVKLDGETVTETDVPTHGLDGVVLQAGKRRFARIRVA